MSKLLEVIAVNKTFCKKNKSVVQVLKNVSFSLDVGESIGIVGESGSGKSTLANILVGLEKQDSGSVLYDGLELHKTLTLKALYQQVQMVFQDPYSVFSPRMTIENFLKQGMQGYRLYTKQQINEQVRVLLHSVGLHPDYLSKLPHELSGGQLQRVVIARALSVCPKIIIFDEATSALDVSIQKQILELLAQLKKEQQLTYIFIGHDLAVVKQITNRMLVMCNGEIVEELDSRALCENANHDYTKQLLQSVYSLK